LSLASSSDRSAEFSDETNAAQHSSAERGIPYEPITIGLHAHAAEPRIVAATARLHAVRPLLVRTTRGATDARHISNDNAPVATDVLAGAISIACKIASSIELTEIGARPARCV